MPLPARGAATHFFAELSGARCDIGWKGGLVSEHWLRDNVLLVGLTLVSLTLISLCFVSIILEICCTCHWSPRLLLDLSFSSDRFSDIDSEVQLVGEQPKLHADHD